MSVFLIDICPFELNQRQQVVFILALGNGGTKD
jgi:hypothetical protein